MRVREFIDALKDFDPEWEIKFRGASISHKAGESLDHYFTSDPDIVSNQTDRAVEIYP